MGLFRTRFRRNTWIEEAEKRHPQAHPESPDRRENPGFLVPKELFKWNNWSYVDKLTRIHRWNIGQRAPPYKMIIVPSNRCNLKCPFCPNSHGRTVGRFKESDELTDEQWYTLVQEALEMGVREFYVLGGGEPLLRKKMLLRIYQIIKGHDQQNITELITNGSFITREDAELIVEKRLINKILFSVDGHTAVIHDTIRGMPRAWKRATDAIRKLHHFKRIHDSDKPILHMNHILTNLNYRHLRDMVELCRELGVVELAIHPMREYEETRGSFDYLKLTAMQEKEMFSELKRARKFAERCGIYLNVSMVEETAEKEETACEEFIVGKDLLQERGEQHFQTFCYEPLYSIFIDPKGNANFCCTAGDSVDSQNVARKGLKAIWEGKFLSAIRKGMLAGRSLPKCHNCGLYDMTHDLKRDMRRYVDYLAKGDDSSVG